MNLKINLPLNLPYFWLEMKKIQLIQIEIFIVNGNLLKNILLPFETRILSKKEHDPKQLPCINK